MQSIAMPCALHRRTVHRRSHRSPRLQQLCRERTASGPPRKPVVNYVYKKLNYESHTFSSRSDPFYKPSIDSVICSFVMSTSALSVIPETASEMDNSKTEHPTPSLKVVLETAKYLKEKFITVYPTARKSEDVEMLKSLGFEHAMQLDVTLPDTISAVIALKIICL